MRLLIQPKPRNDPDALHVHPAAIRVRHRKQRVLDVDIENRPLSYLGSDFTTGEVTALAWAWTDQPKDVTVCLLGPMTLQAMLTKFLKVYAQADVVTGHYLRGHDLPMLNGALMELGMPALSEKMTQDTKLDLLRSKGISLSQESLGAMFKLDAPKVTMNQAKWRAANRLTAEGIAWVKERVTGDVKQHMELRRRLIDRGYLGGGKLWRSNSREPLAHYTA